LALDDADRVVVLRQYRHPVRHKLWEIPAGLLDVPGENPLHAAQRELYEEAHVKAEDWRGPTDGSTTPGRRHQAGRIFLPRRLPVRHKLWEIPAGLLDVPGENPLHAAQRELYEAAHVKAEDWRVLTDVYTTPGGCDEAVRIFLARGLSEAAGDRFEVEHEEAD